MAEQTITAQIPYDLPTKKELYQTTIRMAWPAVVESFLVSLTGFVDTIMVSSLGAASIAAIGLTDQPRFIGLCTFFAMSTAISAIIARRKGENDRDSANRIFRMMAIAGTILCIIISSIMFFGADFIMHVAGSEAETHSIAVGYFRIVSVGLVLTTTTLIFNAAQRGSGNTRISMVTNTAANIVNVILNYILINGHFGFPALGVNGAAIATVIGAGVGCAISIYSMLNPAGFIYLGYTKKCMAAKKDIRSLLDIGASAWIEQVFIRVGFFLFAITVANLGTLALSTHIIAMKLLNLSFSLADGLAVASIALVGRSLGQKRPELARMYGTACCTMGFACSVSISIVYTLFGKSLFSLFTDEPAILSYCNTIIILLCMITYLQIAQVIIMSCLRGAGDTKFAAFTSLISVTIVRPLASWVLCYPCGLGLVGVWLGLMGDQGLRFLFGWLRFRTGKWLTIKM